MPERLLKAYAREDSVEKPGLRADYKGDKLENTVMFGANSGQYESFEQFRHSF